MIACNLCQASSAEQVWQKNGYRLVRCKACGLLYVANPPSQAQLQELYSFERGYHEQLANAEAQQATHEREASRNLSRLRRHCGSGRGLDVGCSTGLFVRQARSAGFEFEGLEYSVDSAAVARDRYGLPVTTGSLVRGRYPENCFDVVTMWDVLEHVPDPREVLGIAFGILRPGGLLVVKTPNADGLYPRLSLLAAGLSGYWGHPEPPGHLYQFSVATLTKLLSGTGFVGQKVEHDRIPLRYSFGTVKNWFRSVKWFGYVAVFAPLALAGPWIWSGDDITVVCHKPGT